MAQEDQTQSTSSGGGNGNNIGRSSKKQRPKKVPQRGLGVAQLEKIRIEEQQMKDAAVAAAAVILPSQSSVISPPSTHHKSPYLSLPISSFHPSKQSCSSSASSIPFPSDLSPPNSIFRTPLSVKNIDIVSTGNTVPLTCSGSPGWHSAATVLPVNDSVNNVHKFWSSWDYSIEKECSGLDPGLAFRTNLSLPYESEPIWPLPSLKQRAQPFQQYESEPIWPLPSLKQRAQPFQQYESEPIWPLPSLKQRAQPFQQPCSSMVNLSSRTSSTSVLNFQMEPPSNQSYYGNCTPSLPEEAKVVGFKRSYPFSPDNAPGPPIHMARYHPIAHSINGQVEEACSAFNFKPGTPYFREGTSWSTSNLESKSKKSIKQSGVFDGDFLTLAPPTTASMCSSSKLKHPPSSLIYYNCELPDLESLASQASFEDSIIRQGASGLNQYYRPYYSFFPPAMVQIDRATTITMAKCKGGEVGGHVDLNLKL